MSPRRSSICSDPFCRFLETEYVIDGAYADLEEEGGDEWEIGIVWVDEVHLTSYFLECAPHKLAIDIG